MEQVQEYVAVRQSKQHNATNDSANNTDNIESNSKEVDNAFDDDDDDDDDRHRTHRAKKSIAKQRRHNEKREHYEKINRRNIIFQRWNCLSYNERKIFHSCAINEKHMYEQQLELWVQQNPNHSNSTVSKHVRCRQNRIGTTTTRNDSDINDDSEECIADDDDDHNDDHIQTILFDSTASPEENSVSPTRKSDIHAKRRKLISVSNLESPPNRHGSTAGPGSIAATNDSGIKSWSGFTDFTSSTGNPRKHVTRGNTGSNSFEATSTTSTATTMLRTNATTAPGSIENGNVSRLPKLPFQVQRPAYNKNVTRMDTTSIMTMEDQLHQRETLQMKLQERIEYLHQELAIQQHRYDTENYNLDCFLRQLHQSIMFSSAPMPATYNVGAAVATTTTTESSWAPHRRTDALDISANRHRQQHTILENHFLPVTALPENLQHQRQIRAAAAGTVPTTPINQRQRKRKAYYSSTKKKTVGGDDAYRKSQSKR